MGELAVVHGAAVNHGDYAVDCDFGRDARPVEGADQRLWQGEARGFDHDVIWLRVTGEQLFHRRDEVIGHGAADAAVGKLDDVVGGAGFNAAAFEDITVNAKIAEFVDDQRDAFTLRVLQHVADEGGFTCAQEACDDGCGDFSGHVLFPI